MKKYYIVKFGQVVSTAELLGEYEGICDAKEDAFGKMNDGDLLVGFPADENAEYTDGYGYDTVKWEDADEDERAFLRETDDSIEDVPSGFYYWSDDNQDTTFYEPNGSRWN